MGTFLLHPFRWNRAQLPGPYVSCTVPQVPPFTKHSQLALSARGLSDVVWGPQRDVLPNTPPHAEAQEKGAKVLTFPFRERQHPISEKVEKRNIRARTEIPTAFPRKALTLFISAFYSAIVSGATRFFSL